MKLTILGSGSAIITPTRSSPGYFLEIGQNKVLIDCGSGTLGQLTKAQINYYNLDYIFISHKHPDHLGDLISILQAIRIWRKHYRKKRKPLTIIGYPDFKQDYKYLRRAMFRQGLENYPVKITEMKKGKRKCGSWIVQSMPVKHLKLSCNAYRFEYKNKGFVYGADCDYYDDNIIKMCKDADLAILDCAFPIHKRTAAHMSPKECGIIATKARIKKIVLTHFYPGAEKYDFKKQTQKYYKGQIVVAKDLMTINI